MGTRNTRQVATRHSQFTIHHSHDRSFIYFWTAQSITLFDRRHRQSASIHDFLAVAGQPTTTLPNHSPLADQSGTEWAVVICLGYLTDVCGALLAALAISLPPFAVLAVGALHKRIGDHPAMDGFVVGWAWQSQGFSGRGHQTATQKVALICAAS